MGKSVERVMYIGAKPKLFSRASEMRSNPTKAEQILWKYLRKFRAKGFPFRQQHPIDIFIADFYCHKSKLVIEVDGDIHFNEQAIEHDDGRTAELEKYGIKVVRFTNDQVINNKSLVFKQIDLLITDLASPALPGAGDGRG